VSEFRLVYMYEVIPSPIRVFRLKHFALLPWSHFEGPYAYKSATWPDITAMCGAEFTYTGWDLLSAETSLLCATCPRCIGY
jgi:hypothetical protein